MKIIKQKEKAQEEQIIDPSQIVNWDFHQAQITQALVIEVKEMRKVLERVAEALENSLEESEEEKSE